MTKLEYKTIMALIDSCVDTKVIQGDTHYYTCNVNKLKAAIESIYNGEIESKQEKCGKWVDWEGWRGNHDMRIEDATCSECGYKHPTVRFEKGDTSTKSVLNKLADKCPKCGLNMDKE